jgi:cell division protein FtsA
MNRKGDKSLIVGLDIGTSKVVALVGEYAPGEPIEVIGIGSHASRGLKRGVVVDIESTVQSIQRAIEEAELMAGCEIRSVYASISGSTCSAATRPASCRSSDGEVTYADMDRVLEAAKAVAIPADQRILHAIPQRVHRSTTRRKASAIRSGCPACAWKCARISWSARCRRRRTSASACNRCGICRSTT